MNTLILQRETNKLENSIKKAKRILFEFEIAQAKWEIAHGMAKSYKSADDLMLHIQSKLR